MQPARQLGLMPPFCRLPELKDRRRSSSNEITVENLALRQELPAVRGEISEIIQRAHMDLDLVASQLKGNDMSTRSS